MSKKSLVDSPRLALPGPGLPVEQGDNLQLTSWSIRADTYQLTVDVQDDQGNSDSIPIQVTLTSDRSGKNVTYSFARPVRIISAGLTQVTGTLPQGPGESFFQLNVIKGGPSGALSATLFAGYWYPGHTPSYPQGELETSHDGRGRIYNVAPGNPSAGAEMVITVPSRARWRVMGVNIKLVTSGVANNRTHHLIIDDGTNTIDQSNGETPAQAATTTRNYLYQPGRSVALETAFDAAGFIRLPIINSNPLILNAASRIRTVSTLEDAGDQYSAPQVWVEEWLQTQ